MDVLNSTPIENGVLSALSPSVYEHLKPRLKRVRLEAGRTLYDLGSASEHAWFITRGIVSYRPNTEAGDIRHYLRRSRRARRRGRSLGDHGKIRNGALGGGVTSK